MTESLLLAELRQADPGLTLETLRAWIREGMPCTGRGRSRRFDQAAVARWLIDSGKASVPRLVGTQRDVAVHFGVDPALIGKWKMQGMPTGPAGGGPFDLDAIEAWRLARSPKPTTDEDMARARQANADASWKELRTAQKAGQLYEVEPARRLILRLVTEAMAILEQIPDRVLALLPASPPAKRGWSEFRRQVRSGAVDLVTDVRRTLADLPAAPEFGGDRDTNLQEAAG